MPLRAVSGETPTRQFHGTTAYTRCRHTGKNESNYCSAFDAASHTQETHARRCRSESTPNAVLSMTVCVQPTLHAVRRIPHVSLRASCRQCLPGRRISDVLHPGIVGMRESTAIQDDLDGHECMAMSTPPGIPVQYGGCSAFKEASTTASLNAKCGLDSCVKPNVSGPDGSARCLRTPASDSLWLTFLVALLRPSFDPHSTAIYSRRGNDRENS